VSLFQRLFRLAIDPELQDGFHEVSEAEMERSASAPPPPIDFAPLGLAGRITLTWLIDLARNRTDDPLDLAALERVHETALATLDGKPCPTRNRASEEDILVVLGLLVTIFETNFHIPGLSNLFGAIYDLADGVSEQAIAAMHADARETSTRRPTAAPAIAVPIVVRRRPQLAFGADESGPVRSIVILR
jgi:hypothetical protein